MDEEKLIFKRKLIVFSLIAVFLVIFAIVGSLANRENINEDLVNLGKEEGSEQALLTTQISNGPFTATYLGNTEDNKYIVSISNSSPSGRVKAIEWLASQGYDIENTQIIFEDFLNPLSLAVSNEES